jgi:type III pantothenate kinase
MLLCIDCGNTNTVVSVWDGTSFRATFRTSTEFQRTADQYFVWLSTLMEHHRVPWEIDEVIISSTAPRVMFNLRVFADRYIGCRPLVVGKPGCRLPIEPRVDPGTQVGPDRIVNTTGAFDRHGGDLIVVDFGTATTFDVCAHDGAYVGGVIAPGVNTSLEAFHHAAAALPYIDVARPEKVIGTNTVACMQSGIWWGYLGIVHHTCDAIKAEYGAPMKIVGTGGLAPLFATGEVLFDTIEEDLTMHGLTVIHRFNKETA